MNKTATARARLRSRASRYRLFALLSMAALAAVAACTQSDWRELAVSDAGFRVLMRGEAHYVRQDLDTPAGKMSAHLYSSDRPDSYFAVGYSDYPLALIVGARPEQVFAGVRDTWVRRIEGKLISSDRELSLAGKYPGMEFIAEGKTKGADTFVQARLYLVEQRLFQVIAMGRKNEVPQGTVNRYLNSFELIPVTETATLQVGPSPRNKP